VLAAFINAVLLLLAMGSLAWEALCRLGTPEPVEAGTVMAVAGVGIVINTLTALLFMSGVRDLNIRGAFLHMAADALVSAGVVAAGALTLWQGWDWLDPVVSLLIAVVIVLGSVGLLRQSVHLLFDGVPADIDLPQVRAWLAAQPGVVQVHDLHVWALGTSRAALTAHLVVPGGHPGDAFLLAVADGLRDHFGIGHVTLQVEHEACQLACDRT